MKMKAAVIGTGFIGPVHVEALRRAGVEVVGILGSSAAKSIAAAEKLEIRRAYKDFSDLLKDGQVDSVHITSPNALHFEQVETCLAAGRHVICEKPLAMNSEQTQRLVDSAKRAQVAAAVNYNVRYYPLCIEASERFRDGEVGELYHVSGGYVQDWLFHRHDYNWRVNSQDGGALRAVADIGTHWMDLIYSITGLEVEELCADLHTVHPTRLAPVGGVETFAGKASGLSQPDDYHPVEVETEDFGSILLRFKGGARGVLWVSQVTAGRKNCLTWELAGSKQAMAWDSERPNEMWIGNRDEANQLLAKDPSLMHSRATQFSNYPAGHNEGFSDTFKQLFVDFYRAIQDGSFQSNPTYPTFEDGHREVLLCESVLRSAAENRWVKV